MSAFLHTQGKIELMLMANIHYNMMILMKRKIFTHFG